MIYVEYHHCKNGEYIVIIRFLAVVVVFITIQGNVSIPREQIHI